jgi:hypothetical protein
VTRFSGLIQALLLAALLATGFVAVWAVTATWVIQAALHVASDRRSYDTLQIRRDGTPEILQYSDGVLRSRSDLEGHRLPPPPDDEVRSGFELVSLPVNAPTPSPELHWEGRIRAFGDGREPQTFWYFIADGREDGSAYFVGYDSQSKELIGYIGTAGFRQEPLPREEFFRFSGSASAPDSRLVARRYGLGSTQFPPEHGFTVRSASGFVAAYDVYVLARDANVYHVDLFERTVANGLPGIKIESAGLSIATDFPRQGAGLDLTLRTEDSVILADNRLHEKARYTIPEPLRGQYLAFARTSSGDIVMYTNTPADSYSETAEYLIYQISPGGEARETALTLRSGNQTLRQASILSGAVVPAPLGLAAIVEARAQQLLDMQAATAPSQARSRAISELWPSLVLGGIIALGFAFLCFRRQVRYGADGLERVIWPLFVLLFGWPGWIGYRYGRTWPYLERCPTCSATVPVDRVACVRCSHEFPRPALKGTEVFA